MVLPNDQVPVCVVIDVRRLPMAGYVCGGCLSVENIGGCWTTCEVPFGTMEGAVRS